MKKDEIIFANKLQEIILKNKMKQEEFKKRSEKLYKIVKKQKKSDKLMGPARKIFNIFKKIIAGEI